MDVRLGSHMAALTAHEALHSESERLSQDNSAIDNGMDQAREKADTQMSAAQAGLVVGIAQGLVSLGAAAAGAAQLEPTTRPMSKLAGMVDGHLSAANSATTEPKLQHVEPHAKESIKGKLDSLSEMGEMEMLRLQVAMDSYTNAIGTASNILKKWSQTADAIVQNMK
ncbi:MAG: hypothetical protein HS128_02990 [Ideonella sp.]|nr:hypothetical protein [Ideonella sp.]